AMNDGTAQSLREDLAGKTALVTGGATGIGLAVATMFAQRGADVVILGHLQAQLDEALASFESSPASVSGLLADVADEASMRAAFSAFDADHSSLSILVCSAAIQPYGTVADTPPELWDQVLSVNLRGVYLACHLAVPRMRSSGGGSIINIASVQGSATQSRVAAYTTSRGAFWLSPAPWRSTWPVMASGSTR
ncbi:MAG: SDR family NAD(P)-dependent oxidoreductase, partial [bacterium]|nr:SDR family NAD(P)-dependent oxidoreductase [bacterium]